MAWTRVRKARMQMRTARTRIRMARTIPRTARTRVRKARTIPRMARIHVRKARIISKIVWIINWLAWIIPHKARIQNFCLYYSINKNYKIIF